MFIRGFNRRSSRRGISQVCGSTTTRFLFCCCSLLLFFAYFARAESRRDGSLDSLFTDGNGEVRLEEYRHQAQAQERKTLQNSLASPDDDDDDDDESQKKIGAAVNFLRSPIASQSSSSSLCSDNSASTHKKDSDSSSHNTLSETLRDKDVTYLPCILNHGCVCNHTLPYFNWADWQLYGTCISCDKGFTGPTCKDRLVECQNFGEKKNGTCHCTPEYSGPSCEQHMCINSKGGVGNYSVTLPDFQNYCRNCKEGHEGITCDMCTADAGCQEGSYCSRDPMFLYKNHKMMCEITNEDILDSLEWGRRKIAANIAVNCSSASGWPEGGKDGNCTAALYREEFIDKPREMYIDPFFFCTMFECGVTEKEIQVQLPNDEDRDRVFAIVRDLGMGLLLFLVFSVSVAKYVPIGKKYQKLPVKVSLGALVAGVIIYIVALECLMVSAPTKRERKVTLHCNQASCICGPDARLINNSYAPNCNETTFASAILPNIKGNIDITCNENNDCAFEPRDLALSIPLRCKHSECVDNNVVPRKAAPHEEDMEISAIIATASIIFVCLAALTHYLVCRYKSKIAAEEFANSQFVLGGSGCFSSGRASPMFASSSAITPRSNHLSPTTKTAQHHTGGGVNGKKLHSSSSFPNFKSLITPQEGESVSLTGGTQPSTAAKHSDENNSSSRKNSYKNGGKNDGRSLSETDIAAPSAATLLLMSSPSPALPPATNYHHNQQQHQLSAINRHSTNLDIPCHHNGGNTINNDNNNNMPANAVNSKLLSSPVVEPPTRNLEGDTNDRLEATQQQQQQRLLLPRSEDDAPQSLSSTPSPDGFGFKPLTTCQLSVENLNYTVRSQPWPPHKLTADNSKQILFNISLVAESGDVVALMGASGAGKTTLLDILAARGKTGKISGEIRLNGSVVLCGEDSATPSSPRNKKKRGIVSSCLFSCCSSSSPSAQRKGYRGLVGYVSQEDTLLPHLTVRETLRYAAMLKLPTAFTPLMIERVVEDVIISLKLSRCADTIIGDGQNTRGLSGGEKRRVSIGAELVANPRILFLDEPTSGLDAANALNVMEVVAEVAKESPLRRHAPNFFTFNPIIIASIHQPSRAILKRFTKVVLLSRGKMIFSGGVAHSAASVLAHLSPSTADAIQQGAEGDDNPAEVLLAVDDHISDFEREQLATWARKEEEERQIIMRKTQESSGLRAPFPSSSKLPRVGAQQTRNDNHIDDKTDNFVPDTNGGGPLATSLLYEYGHNTVSSSGDENSNANNIIAEHKANKRYYMHIYSQFGLLVRRAHASLMGAYYLVAAHGLVAFIMGLLMCYLYQSQPLTLPGTLNRAGSVTFLLLVQSFISLSALEQLMTEKKLFVTERENGFYSTLPYLASKIVVDIFPLRIIPSVFVSSLIYFPMGLRMDNGTHFLWFIFIVALFTCTITMLVVCIGAVSQSFGSAALVAAVLILWNFVFGGLLVQSQTIPEAFEPFKNVSPFYFAFEALMVNDLKGQMCEFSPTNDAGQPSDLKMPVHCTQYIYNLGLKPDRFNLDIVLLGGECVFLVILAYILMTFVRVTR